MFNLFSKKPIQNISFYALLDSKTKAILCTSPYFQIINYLKASFPDSEFALITSKDFLYNQILQEISTSNEPYLFKWDSTQAKVVKNPNLSEELKKLSTLAQAKQKILQQLYFKVEEQRAMAKKNIAYQDIIYIEKEKEAIEFKSKNYPENEIFDYPYILQYADLKNISYKEATESILAKAKINRTAYLRSEYIRLYFFEKIKNAKNLEDLENLKLELQNELA